MNSVSFLAEFGHIANAPDGVERLRALVLQLATTGMLVVSDETEGNAEALISNLAKEKERLIASSAVKATSPLPPVDLSNPLPDVPSHWRWIRLGNLTSKIGSGSTPRGGSQVYVSKGVPFLRSQNVWNDGIHLDDAVHIAPETHQGMRNTHVLPDDILLNITGASLGRCASVPSEFPTANVSQHVTIIRPLLADIRHFIRICLLSPFGQQMIWGRQVGMAREGLSKKVLEQFEIPLPPLAEQKRIVAKVDELMALCDQLEAQQQERERRFPVLSRTCHARFAEAPTTANLNRIFDETGTVSPPDLRKTILTLAVEGKLSRVSESKHVALEEVIQLISGQHLLANEQNNERKGIPYLTGPSDFGVRHPRPTRWTETPKVVAEPGDILITVKGAGVGKTNKLVDGQTAISRQLMAVRVTGADPDFVHMVLNNASGHFQSSMTGIAIPGIGRRDVLALTAELPPIAEQRRIVAKVDELIDLVDHLEAQQQERDKLAEAFAKACVSSFTGTTQPERPEKMKAPKTELVSLVTLGKKPKPDTQAPLAQLLLQHKGTLPAKSLWQQSGLTIDAFYQQLKAEIGQGWIAPPAVAEMKVLEEA